MIAGWNDDLLPRAKEILYGCLEQLQATRAALYLSSQTGVFELVTSYGFSRREAVTAEIDASHTIWDWVRRHRTLPSYDNEPRQAELRRYLEQGGTRHLLTVPLTAADRLVGFIDARDKARGQPFAVDDVATARGIAAAFEDFLADHALFGAVRRQGSDAGESRDTTLAGTTAALHQSAVASLGTVIRHLANLPGIGALALTVGDGSSARVTLHGRCGLDAQQREALARHQSDALATARAPAPPIAAWTWSEHNGPVDFSRCTAVHTTVLSSSSTQSLILSAITDSDTAVWQAVLATASHHLVTAQQLRDYRLAARNLARILLEPGETSFLHLRQHSQAVSELAQQLALALGLDPAEEELVTVAGYLHDVGMRELDYARIYRMPHPGESERRYYQRHPVIGARILESAAFPGDLAGAVRHHHERWDGEGYPQKLAGERIPRASRIIHLAEVFDVLTSPSSYKPAIGRDAALAAIRAEAGTQFDPELVPVLEKVVSA